MPEYRFKVQLHLPLFENVGIFTLFLKYHLCQRQWVGREHMHFALFPFQLELCVVKHNQSGHGLHS